MLSVSYRMRLRDICDKIRQRLPVELNEMIWAQKLAQANHSAYEMLQSARREASSGEDPLSNFLRDLKLGDPDPSNHKTGFDSVDEIVEWFRRDPPDDWLRRD